MKILWKFLAILIVLGVAGLVVVEFFPGLREQGKQLYRKYGGWNQEARQADPVGFIEYAIDELEKDLTTLQETRTRLGNVLHDLEKKQRRTQKRRDNAEQLAEQFRAAYQRAEEGGGYPVKVSGQAYDRNQLKDQVRLILLQREQYSRLLKELEKAKSRATDRRRHLGLRISKTKASLSTLPAQREVARLKEISDHTESLLNQVDSVMTSNEEVLEHSPVRTVEELTAAEKNGDSEGMSGSERTVDVEAFLKEGS